MEDLLLDSTKPGVKHVYFGKSGSTQTVYLNTTPKGSNLYAYDRKAKLNAQTEDGIGNGSVFGKAKYTRIECRLSPNKSASKLGGAYNPLKKLMLLDIEAPEPPEEPHHWELFKDSCRYRGLAGALELLPPPVRQSYEQALDDAKGILWRPEELWKFWPEALDSAQLVPITAD